MSENNDKGIWQIVMFGLAASEYRAYVLTFILMAVFIYNYRSIHKQIKNINSHGYIVTKDILRLTDLKLLGIILSLLFVAMTCGYLFGGSYRMDWKLKELNMSAEATSVENNLRQLGFPDNILNDLSIDDLMECKTAVKVII